MKYWNRKITVYGIQFDSRKEADRYLVLRDMAKQGEIRGLQTQPEFELIPKQPGEQGVKYIADFLYEQAGKTVVEDVKGYRTKDYIIKRKLFKWRYPGIEFREVRN